MACVQTYLFDLYGVLLTTQTDAHLRAIEAAVGTDERLWPLYWELRGPLDAGELTPEEYWERIRVALELPSFDIDAVVEADIASWLDEDADAVAYVGELIDAGHRVGLLSNIPTFLAERVRARHTWLERFDAVTMSCDIGVAKPDPGAYRAACAALGAEPGEVLFFDDNPVNVAAAREFGMRAVEVTGRLVEWNH